MADAIIGVAETPLQDLLRRIPRDAIYQWTTPEADREVWQLSYNSAPIGRLAHEAADRLDKAASPPARKEAEEVQAWLIEHPTKRRRVVDAKQYDASGDDFWISPEAKAEHTVTALTVREEAPAETCKSCNGTRRELGSAFNRCEACREEAPALIDTLNAASAKVALNPERAAEIRANWTNGEEAPAEGAGDDAISLFETVCEYLLGEGPLRGQQFGDEPPTMKSGHLARYWWRSDLRDARDQILSALRNRTSEPEAGAVAWLYVTSTGLKTASVEPVSRINGEEPVEVQPLYTHPAPATADKLKVAVEALEKAYRAWFVEAGESAEVLECVGPLLSALNEQPQ